MTAKSRRVLVVDDAADLRELLGIALRREGFDVVPVDGGPAAASVLSEEEHDIEAVVLDIQMPDVDGWEVLARIRSEPSTAELPVIVCTVKGRDHDIERVYASGGNAYVGKPFDIAELVQALQGVLGAAPKG